MKKAKPKAKKAVKKKAAKKPAVKRKPAKKKPAKKKKAPKAKGGPGTPRPGVIAPLNSVLLGFVEDYFAHIGVIALTLKSAVAVGQRIQVLGHTTNFEAIVGSMQIDHTSVTQAGPKDGVGIKVIGRARSGDHVYLLK